MDRAKRDLEAVVASQKEQLTRYEKRLKDVVTAYKGLLKEKEALETSLAAIQSATKQSETIDDERKIDTPEGKPAEIKNQDDTSSEIAKANENLNADDKNNFQTQILTLMNSLATLSAEKSRMEASFQADKKQLRAQLNQKDQAIADLKANVKATEERYKSEVDEVKAKWIIERQEREKETNNQMLMIRELQKLYADERHLKENIEMQLNNFKTQFADNEAENSRLRDLQAQLKEAKSQIKLLQGSKNSGGQGSDSAAVLRQVRQEMQQLKEQHAVAIKNEQHRALIAEEQSKKQAALHEDRVANLESRLAELSSTVGSYDRLRQKDQQSIQSLKTRLQELESTAETVGRDLGSVGPNRKVSLSGSGRGGSVWDIAAIVEEIMNLKKLVLVENARSANPVDLTKVFAVGADHSQCQEEIRRLQELNETSQIDVYQLQAKIQLQNNHISTLQEKVKVLNRNIEEQETELKLQGEKIRLAVKEERDKWRLAIAEKDNEFRSKVNDLEQQLQKQRQRSLQLLDEKEQEIKTLQTSIEVLHSAANRAIISPVTTGDLNATATSSDAESADGGPTTSQARVSVKSKRMSMGENCHMLHYANEIARKDIEIAGLRKSKYSAETALRRAIQEKVTAQEELSDKIANLEEQVDRLERCKTREGANLEYLKNVTISYLVTKDADSRRHMINAISAVLQLTPAEMQMINAAPKI